MTEPTIATAAAKPALPTTPEAWTAPQTKLPEALTTTESDLRQLAATTQSTLADPSLKAPINYGETWEQVLVGARLMRQHAGSLDIRIGSENTHIAEAFTPDQIVEARKSLEAEGIVFANDANPLKWRQLALTELFALTNEPTFQGQPIPTGFIAEVAGQAAQKIAVTPVGEKPSTDASVPEISSTIESKDLKIIDAPTQLDRAALHEGFQRAMEVLPENAKMDQQAWEAMAILGEASLKSVLQRPGSQSTVDISNDELIEAHSVLTEERGSWVDKATRRFAQLAILEQDGPAYQSYSTKQLKKLFPQALGLSTEAVGHVTNFEEVSAKYTQGMSEEELAAGRTEMHTLVAKNGGDLQALMKVATFGVIMEWRMKQGLPLEDRIEPKLAQDAYEQLSKKSPEQVEQYAARAFASVDIALRELDPHSFSAKNNGTMWQNRFHNLMDRHDKIFAQVSTAPAIFTAEKEIPSAETLFGGDVVDTEDPKKKAAWLDYVGTNITRHSTVLGSSRDELHSGKVAAACAQALLEKYAQGIQPTGKLTIDEAAFSTALANIPSGEKTTPQEFRKYATSAMTWLTIQLIKSGMKDTDAVASVRAAYTKSLKAHIDTKI